MELYHWHKIIQNGELTTYFLFVNGGWPSHAQSTFKLFLFFCFLKCSVSAWIYGCRQQLQWKSIWVTRSKVKRANNTLGTVEIHSKINYANNSKRLHVVENFSIFQVPEEEYICTEVGRFHKINWMNLLKLRLTSQVGRQKKYREVDRQTEKQRVWYTDRGTQTI